MSSLKAMPCISNSKVAILSCFTRPQLPTHSSILLSTLWGQRVTIFQSTRFSSQIRRSLAHSSRWHPFRGEAWKSSKKRSPSSGYWGFESGQRERESPSSSGSNVRTFASSPQGSDNSQNSEGVKSEEQANVEKFVGKGLLVKAAEALEETLNKPEICTADELHYVAVPETKWRLALWRYRPPPNTPKRNHPLLMLSGIGTNAVGFDLDPSVSMARSMAGAGFETWILEVRGAGLSKSEEQLAKEGKPSETSDGILVVNKVAPEDDKVDPATKGSSEPTGEQGTVTKVDRPTNGSSELTGEEGTADKMDPLTKGFSEPIGEEGTVAVAELDSSTNASSEYTSEEGNVNKVDPSSKRSREPTSEEGDMTDIGPPTKRSSKPTRNEGTLINQEDNGGFSLKAVGGGFSSEAWKTATLFSEAIGRLSDNLNKLVLKGEVKILSSRFIDSVVSLFDGSGISKRIVGLRERLSSVLEAQENRSAVSSQLTDLRKKLAQLLEDGQGAVSPRVTNLQERLNSTVDDFQKLVDLITKYDWDFDNYLEEDVPTAMEYIRNICKPVDGKLLSVGHSMGGIVLYALLSTRGNQSGLAGAVALASALDYQCSDTSLKLLLPLSDPAQILNVPVVPLGGLMTVVHPLVTRAPYALAWLGYQVSAQKMMKPELFSKLVLNNFGTIPMKLLLHLVSVFQPGGLANRDGTFNYKKNLGTVTIPVLAVAGDQDLICPPPAVLDTVHLFPKETITYKCFGGENERHYGHYDIVCSPGAKEEVFPVVLDFLVQNDEVKVGDKAKIEVEA